MGSPTGTIHCAGGDKGGNSEDFRCVTKDSHWSVGSWQLSPPGALISLLVGGAVPGCIRAVLGITQGSVGGINLSFALLQGCRAVFLVASWLSQSWSAWQRRSAAAFTDLWS